MSSLMRDEMMGCGFFMFFQVDARGGGGGDEREDQYKIHEDYLIEQRRLQIMREDDEIALLIRILVTKGFL